MHRIKNLALMTLVSASMFVKCTSENKNILVCYGDFYPQKIANYNYVIVEPSLFSKADVAILKKQNDFVIAYISLGEVNEGATYYEKIKAETIGENENWNSHTLDIKAVNTKNTLNYLIDKHLTKKAFDGLFLDNIDNYTQYGPTPEKKEELLAFLKAIKTKYPKTLLIQNSGLLLLEETKQLIDIVVLESVATDYNFEKSDYRLRNEEEFNQKIKEVEEKQRKYNIPFFLIEYANTKALADQVKERLAGKKTSYFISEINLQKPPKEE